MKNRMLRRSETNYINYTGKPAVERCAQKSVLPLLLWSLIADAEIPISCSRKMELRPDRRLSVLYSDYTLYSCMLDYNARKISTDNSPSDANCNVRSG